MFSPIDPYIEAFAKAGADIITVHPEAGPHLHRTLQLIKSLGKKAGVSLNPGTTDDTIDAVIGDVDLILCMSVHQGYGGQSLLPSAPDKIHALRPKNAATGHSIE